MSDPFTLTVSPSLAAIQSALAANVSTPGKVVIAVSDGVLVGGTLNNITGMSSRASNVLIRPVNIGGVKNSGMIHNNCDGTSLAHFVGDGWYLGGTKNQSAINNVISKGTQCKVFQPVGYEVIGNIALNRITTGSDRIQVVGTNGLHWANWWEGKDRDLSISPAPHVDTMQILGHSGFFTMKNQYHGGAGSNAAFFYKQDQQGGLPEPQITLDTVYFAQNPSLGTNDVLILLYGSGQTVTMKDVISQRNIRIEFSDTRSAWDSTYVPFSVTGCRAQKYSLLNSSGVDIGTPPTGGVTIGTTALPTFIPPTWWDHSWDSL